MRLLVSILCSMLCYCSFAFVDQKVDDNITLLANPEDKNVCIVVVNEEYFFAHISDIHLINTNIIDFIEMYMPENMFFKKVKEKYPVLSRNIQAVFVIKTFKGGELPKKFVKEDDKKKKL